MSRNNNQSSTTQASTTQASTYNSIGYEYSHTRNCYVIYGVSSTNPNVWVTLDTATNETDALQKLAIKQSNHGLL